MIDISKFVDIKSIKQDITFIYIHRDDKNLYTVATDSYRIARIAYNLQDEPFYSRIEDGYYTPKYFSQLCKSLLAKKASEYDKQLSILAFNATKSTLELNYPEYQQLIKKYEEDKIKDKLQHGIIGKYNQKYLCEFLELVSKLKDFKQSRINYRTGELDTTEDITSRYLVVGSKPMVYQKNDSYILLMPLNH